MQRDSQSPAGPQLAQAEREAIVDLLHFCIYADSLIALREGEFINAALASIGWDENHSFASFEARSIAGARTARDSDAAKQGFLDYAAERLKAPAARYRAVELCAKLFNADGKTAAQESTLLKEIRSKLG